MYLSVVCVSCKALLCISRSNHSLTQGMSMITPLIKYMLGQQQDQWAQGTNYVDSKRCFAIFWLKAINNYNTFINT